MTYGGRKCELQTAKCQYILNEHILLKPSAKCFLYMWKWLEHEISSIHGAGNEAKFTASSKPLEATLTVLLQLCKEMLHRYDNGKDYCMKDLQ
jgi:hypothetical protein